MKTIKVGDTIKRTDDETADRKVRNENAEFIPKKVWKEQVRDINKKEPETKVVKKHKK